MHVKLQHRGPFRVTNDPLGTPQVWLRLRYAHWGDLWTAWIIQPSAVFYKFFGRCMSVIQKRGRTPASLLSADEHEWNWFIPSRRGISELGIATRFSKQTEFTSQGRPGCLDINACWKFNIALRRLPPPERSAPWQMGLLHWRRASWPGERVQDLLEWMLCVLLKLLACTKHLRGFLDFLRCRCEVGWMNVVRVPKENVFR